MTLTAPENIFAIPASTGSLSERAMLVSLSVSLWTARKLDRKVTKEVADKHGTTEFVGRYNKRLLPQDAESYAKIVSAASSARNSFYQETLPWSQTGAQILPAANFFEFSRKMREYREAFESAVGDFLTQYPTLVENARATLNGLFNYSDYPTQGQLRRKFNFETCVMPFPDALDFRVDIGNEHVTRLRAEIERNVDTATKDAMREVWTRLSTALGKMAERLSQPEGIYRDSLFGNLAELCDVLPRLNLTGDPRLTAMTEEIRKKVLVCSPQEAREDKERRTQIALRVKEIEKSVSACFVSLEEE